MRDGLRLRRLAARLAGRDAPAPSADARGRRRGGLRAVVLAAAVAVVAMLLWTVLLALRFEDQGARYDYLRWELASLPNKWLGALGAPLRDDPAGDEAIARYFAFVDRTGRDAVRLEGAVEATIEGRIDAVLQQAGVRGRLPLPGSVFPPVDIELARPPWVLVVSPRERIERIDEELLAPGVTPEEAVERERAREADDEAISALVLRTGGVALYPAVVNSQRGYAATVATAAHEWVHHYLAFYPLGLSYFRSQEVRTINETVADIAGDEIAALVIERFGDPTIGDGGASGALSAGSTADAGELRRARRDEALRELHLAVDDLLAAGRIAEAEHLMEQTRDELAAGGIVIRRINQAYFAWFGTYAARGDAVHPVGEELRALRARMGSLAVFLDEVREVTSHREVRDLARAWGLAVPAPAP